MAVSQLTTAVSNVVTRVVTLEPLAIAQVTSGTVAKAMWYWNSQTFPFWGNRPRQLRRLRPGGDDWELTIEMRLWVATMEASAAGSTTAQDVSWSYVAETLSYFEAIRTSLAPEGYAEIDYLGREGLTITCRNGEDFGQILGTDMVYITFQLIVPFLLVGT